MPSPSRKYNRYKGGRRGLLEIEKPRKKCRKPQNRNKFRPKPKTELSALTDKALEVFRISLSLINLIFIRLNLLYLPQFFLHIALLVQNLS